MHDDMALCENDQLEKMAIMAESSCVMCDDPLPVKLERNYNFKYNCKLSDMESTALCKVLRLPTFPFDFQFQQAYFCKDCKTYIKKSSVIFEQIESLNRHLTQIRSVMQNKLAKFATVLHSHTAIPTNLQEVNIRNKSVNDNSFTWEIRKQVFESLQAIARKEINFDFEGDRNVSQSMSVRVQKGHLTDCLTKTEKEINNSLSPQSMNSELSHLSQHDNHLSPDGHESDLSSQPGCIVTKAFEESVHLSPQVVENQEPASNSETVNLQSVESNDIENAEAGYDTGSQKSPENSDNDNIQIPDSESRVEKTNERFRQNSSSTTSNCNDNSEKYDQSTPIEERDENNDTECANVDKHCQTEEPVDKLEYEITVLGQTATNEQQGLLEINQENLERDLPNKNQENIHSKVDEDSNSETQIISLHENQVQSYIEDNGFRKEINIQCSLDFSALTESDGEGGAVASLLLPGIDFSAMNENQSESSCNLQSSTMLSEMSFAGQQVQVSIANNSIIFSTPSSIATLGSVPTSSLSKMDLPTMVISSVNDESAIPAELDFSSFPGTDDMSTTTVEVSTTGLPELHFSQITVDNNSELESLQSQNMDLCPFSNPMIPMEPNTDTIQLSSSEVSSTQFRNGGNDLSLSMPKLKPVSPVDSGCISSESDIEPPRLLKEKASEFPKMSRAKFQDISTTSFHTTPLTVTFVPNTSSHVEPQNVSKPNYTEFHNFPGLQRNSEPLSSSFPILSSATEPPKQTKEDAAKYPVIFLPGAQLISSKAFVPPPPPPPPKLQDSLVRSQPDEFDSSHAPPLATETEPLEPSSSNSVVSLPPNLGTTPKSHSTKCKKCPSKRNKANIAKTSTTVDAVIEYVVESSKNYTEVTIELPDLPLSAAVPVSSESSTVIPFELHFGSIPNSNDDSPQPQTQQKFLPVEAAEINSATESPVISPDPPANVDSPSISIRESPKAIAKPTKKKIAEAKINQSSAHTTVNTDSDDEISIVAEYRPNPSASFYARRIQMQKSGLKALQVPNSRGYQIARYTPGSRKKPTTVFNVAMDSPASKSKVISSKDGHVKKKSYSRERKSEAIRLSKMKSCKESLRYDSFSSQSESEGEIVMQNKSNDVDVLSSEAEDNCNYSFISEHTKEKERNLSPDISEIGGVKHKSTYTSSVRAAKDKAKKSVKCKRNFAESSSKRTRSHKKRKKDAEIPNEVIEDKNDTIESSLVDKTGSLVEDISKSVLETPPAVAEKQSSKVDEKPTSKVDEKPTSKVMEKPTSKVMEKPSKVREKLSSKVMEKPSNVIEQSSTVVETPSNVVDNPSPQVVEMLSKAIEKPSPKVVEKLPEVIEKPCMTTEKPSTKDIEKTPKVPEQSSKLLDKPVSTVVSNVFKEVSERILSVSIQKISISDLKLPSGVFIGGKRMKVNPASLYLLNNSRSNKLDQFKTNNELWKDNGIPANEVVDKMLANVSESTSLINETVKSVASESGPDSLADSLSVASGNERNPTKAKGRSHKKSSKKAKSVTSNRPVMPISERQQIRKLLEPSLNTSSELCTNTATDNPPIPIPDKSYSKSYTNTAEKSNMGKRPIKLKISKKRLADGTEAVEVWSPRRSIDEESEAGKITQRRSSKSESSSSKFQTEPSLNKREVSQTSSGRTVYKKNYD